ncbi:DnaD domain protein [Listeria grandensis]|uniref:DnaD domain protein n=1 Tax=Listeria grandensis TaxID=1494963 RepID=A0A7X0Y1M9_9LIST|nr:DnaD domain protein [Listeria grandensis]MBC1935219.1 DnaD domain protein [Listeria grandensis]
MSDSLKIQGIYAQGYGMIAKTVMRDKELSIEAKSIYSYLASFAGAGSTAFPTIELMLGELNISRDRFYKHRKQLVEKGYIKIIQQKGSKGLQMKNVYEIVNNPEPENPQSQNKATDDEPQSSYPESCYPTADNKESDNKDGISNSLIINNLINNNTNNKHKEAAALLDSDNNISSVDDEEKEAAAAETIPIDLNASPINLYEANIGQLSPLQSQSLLMWLEDFKENRMLINYGIYRAGMKGARTYALLESIFKDWQQKNITNLSTAITYEMGGRTGGKQAKLDGGRKKNYDW